MIPEPWDGVSYCVNGDGNPATVQQPVGMTDDHPITEWVCWDCARKEPHMIAVEIPASLADRPEVVAVDAPDPCPACGCYPTDIDPDVRARCGFCDDRGEGLALSSLVGQRVALAWRETCPTCGGDRWLREYNTMDARPRRIKCGCDGSRMVVGWTAEVAEALSIKGMNLGTVINLIRNYPDVDWSTGRYALVLRNVQGTIGDDGNVGPYPCRPFSGFAELDEVLA